MKPVGNSRPLIATWLALAGTLVVAAGVFCLLGGGLFVVVGLVGGDRMAAGLGAMPAVLGIGGISFGLPLVRTAAQLRGEASPRSGSRR
jgi:hypothetical protein